MNQRRKGHQYERDTAIAFKKLFPEAKRHLEYQACEANGVDITGTGPFAIQCKRGRKYAPLTAIKEIQDTKKIPLLVTQGDNEKSMVGLYLSDFLYLLEQIGNY